MARFSSIQQGAAENGAIAPLTMHAVFVRFEEEFLAIWLSEKTSWNNGVSSSAKANGMLRWTSNVATLTSARMTSVNALETGCRLRLCSFYIHLMHGFADMSFHIMSAHVAAADISVTKSAVKTVLVSTHLVDKRIHLYPCWAKFHPVDSSAFHLSLAFLEGPGSSLLDSVPLSISNLLSAIVHVHVDHSSCPDAHVAAHESGTQSPFWNGN